MVCAPPHCNLMHLAVAAAAIAGFGEGQERALCCADDCRDAVARDGCIPGFEQAHGLQSGVACVCAASQMRGCSASAKEKTQAAR
eukprot:CAMPEP_0204216638 /NCGR_PEP_ID=MMETSP0361-20130328/78340_1 /ASSEMBLY_ACC=CAM_ASM_000343 /TAXON_ID=268821 /ORGANISM="Scrippsiella Hangoei, Strain SHTV-5" /LENGTH=84 /DNA_ID=CAMNT_0051181539 /DNA_START=207 /DNA_END=461 /DNA_ORIENTATION=-